MDTWNKYKHNSYNNINLNKIDVSLSICYANFLLSKIIYKMSQDKKCQKTINKFFDISSIILKATALQKGFKTQELPEIYSHIDNVTRDILNNSTDTKTIALMLGNLSEIVDAKYTLVELIGFVRALASEN